MFDGGNGSNDDNVVDGVGSGCYNGVKV